MNIVPWAESWRLSREQYQFRFPSDGQADGQMTGLAGNKGDSAKPGYLSMDAMRQPAYFTWVMASDPWPGDHLVSSFFFERRPAGGLSRLKIQVER
jgi:hypothetical protein